MKKICTLLLAAVLVSAAAFAQDGRHGYYNDSHSYNSWQQQYPSVNGYAYSTPYGYDTYGSLRDYDRHREWRKREEREEYERMMRRQQWLNEQRYRNRSGVSFQVTIGGHRPLY